MRRHILLITTVLAAFIGVATAVAVPASAREHAHHQFGTPQQLVDAGGAVVQEWTVTGLQRSTAALPGYAARGQLWEATATVRAVTGTVTPIIPNLHAVTAGGQRWPVIWQIANPQGLPGATLAQGQAASGKVYFDVIEAKPMAVIYDNGSGAPLMWCCTEGMTMPMPMDNCPMCSTMSQPCPHCRDSM